MADSADARDPDDGGASPITPPSAPPITTAVPTFLVRSAASGSRIAVAPAVGERAKVCPKCLGRYPEDFVVCPKDATPLELAEGEADPLLGAVLAGTYQITRILGEGGMGKVYEARHLRLASRRFAIKILHGELVRNQDSLARFQREAEASAAIHHSHVVEVFDVARTDDGRPFIVSEFLEGEDFHDHLERIGRLDVASSIAITRQVAAALAAAHDAGVVHRDLKPENLYVVRGRAVVGRPDAPFVKVLDFGISKVAGEGPSLTRTGMIMGTPNYMAPEQARGDKVDHRVDVYALGAILYRMLTGKRAFGGTDPTAVITEVLSSEPTRPRELEPSIPEALELVIQRAMAKDARDRYQTMRELDRALAAFDAEPSSPSLVAPPPGVTIAPSSGEAIAAAEAHAHTFAMLSPPPPAAAIVSPRAGAARGRAAIEQESQKVRRARPTIVALTPVVLVWLLVLVDEAVAGAIRAIAGREPTDSELTLIMSFSGAAAITPLVLWIVHVVRHVWPNSVRSTEVADDLGRLVLGSFAAYGLAAIGVRFGFTLAHRTLLVSLGWLDLVYLAVALLGGALAGGVGPLSRLRRRLSLDRT
jgi:serine/threonine-protein kinase